MNDQEGRGRFFKWTNRAYLLVSPIPGILFVLVWLWVGQAEGWSPDEEGGARAIVGILSSIVLLIASFWLGIVGIGFWVARLKKSGFRGSLPLLIAWLFALAPIIVVVLFFLASWFFAAEPWE